MSGDRFLGVRSISSVLLLRCAVVCLLLAEVWLHVVHEPPYQAFLWDQQFMGWIVKITTGLEWRDFLMNPIASMLITVFTRTMIGLLLLGLVSSLLITEKRPWAKYGLYLSSGILCFQAFCSFLNVGYQLPMLLEHALRMATPWFLVVGVLKGFTVSVQRAMLVTIGLTFSSHGLYALGLGVPVPGHFIDMVMESMGVSQGTAKTMLLIAGILDQVMVAGLIFVVTRKFSLLYGVFWGFVTAFARLTSYVRFDVLFGMSLMAYFPEFLVRAPHFMIPLVVWRVMRDSPNPKR